jgi:tRNA dimethylallyltransferase
VSGPVVAAGGLSPHTPVTSRSDCLAITGATATGKTGVAIEVAKRINGEIISLDSRQVYRQMDIGTAKATAEQCAAVPHHGIDLLEPSERYNAGRFAADARIWMADIQARDRVPILAGGTGFFLRALTHPMFEEPEVDERRKEALKHFFNRLDREELRRWLLALDQQGLRRLSPEAGRQRIARMLEVVLLTGHPLHWWQQRFAGSHAAINMLTIVLELPRNVLYERINNRVTEMVQQGLVEEVERLLAQGYDEHSPGMKTTGYAEMIAYFKGEASLEATIDAVQRATRRYARRQETWFRHQLAEPVVRIDATRPHDEIVENIAAEWRKHHANRN